MTTPASAAHAPAAGLDRLAPISLDELVTVASLQTRVDRKYVITRDRLDTVLAGLEPATRMLEIDQLRDFGYESMYFDTPQLASFYSAAHKHRRRFKIRTRTYTDSAECFLEVKTEGARAATVKERLEHDVARPNQLGTAGEAYAADVLTDAGIDGTDTRELRPILRTSYRRSTLYVPSSRSRATIDVDLAWELESGRRLDLPRLAVVETKSGSTPSAVDRLLWSHGLRPTSISKYATGLAALMPTLPRNKWAPVLRAHFTPAPAPAPRISRAL